jgi:hypothetical protein
VRTTLRDENPRVNSGRIGVRARLTGQARREWESSLISRPGMRGSRLAVLRVLLDSFAWGKPSCYPSNAKIAKSAGLSVSTVKRCLHDLVLLGVVELERGDRRVIHFPSHPAASPTPVKLTHPPVQIDPPTPVQIEPQSVKPFPEPSIETVGSSLEQERSTKIPSGFDWRTLVDDPIIAAALKPPAAAYTPGPETIGESDLPNMVKSQRCDSEPARGLQVAADDVMQALAALRPGATRQEITVATLKLTRHFQDPGSRRFYSSVAQKIGRGELPARVVVAAVERSSRPGVIKPAAVFTAHIRRVERVAMSRIARE